LKASAEYSSMTISKEKTIWVYQSSSLSFDLNYYIKQLLLFLNFSAPKKYYVVE
jgi:hypothetical protein